MRVLGANGRQQDSANPLSWATYRSNRTQPASALGDLPLQQGQILHFDPRGACSSPTTPGSLWATELRH